MISLVYKVHSSLCIFQYLCHTIISCVVKVISVFKIKSFTLIIIKYVVYIIILDCKITTLLFFPFYQTIFVCWNSTTACFLWPSQSSFFTISVRIYNLNRDKVVTTNFVSVIDLKSYLYPFLSCPGHVNHRLLEISCPEEMMVSPKHLPVNCYDIKLISQELLVCKICF